MSGAGKTITLERALPMWQGGELEDVTLAYETWGKDRGDNRVLIFTGLSPSAHAASSPEDDSPGWWEDIIGPGKPLDTDHYHVICFNSLGSCFGSTGPASINPASGKPWAIDFPELHIEDIARSIGMALEQLGLDELDTIVGPSMGGMIGLAYLLLHPGKTRRFLSISSAMAADPYAIAVRSLQRELIRSDAAWQDGRYAPDQQPIAGMRLARKLGMTTYRSATEWRQRFARDRIAGEKPGHPAFPLEFEVEGYLEAAAEKFVGGFDANCYQYLSRAMDLFDAAAHAGGDIDAAMDKLQLESAHVIGVETDILFPPHQQRELARAIDAAGIPVEYTQMASLQGHDAFLTDMERFQPVIAEYLRPADLRDD
ncbi:MAG: homoserine O-acetyltransferase [Gammaproteobacteria bacterium]|nr:homoserine O-acetyltransferase [Gammaproteobacteria bacterium]